MNPLHQQIVFDANKKRGNKENNDEINRALMRMRLKIKREVIAYLQIAIGVFLAGFGLKSFLLAGGFIDGGITGISLLVSEVTGLSLPLLLLCINLPFVFIGLKQMGKGFALKTAIGIFGFALCVAVVNYPILTTDKLLIAVFGGFFLGGGVGLAIRGGGVLDGTEVMAIYIEKKTALSLGDIILVFNIIIFSVAAYFLSIEASLYSILTYMAASKTVDFILEGIEEYTGVTIVSARAGEIRKMITEELNKGITVYKGSRGYGKTGAARGDLDILYTVITRLEVTRLKNEIEKIDSRAFIVMNTVKETKGGMVKKRAHELH